MYIGQHFSEFNLKKKDKSVGVEQMSKKSTKIANTILCKKNFLFKKNAN